MRIRTVVGQTDSKFQAALRPEGYGWRLDKRSPGGHLFDDMVHKYAMALWLVDQDIISVQAVVRRRDIFFEPCAVIFEYEDPELLGTMEVQYARDMWMRSGYFGADEFFEVQGEDGFLWVTRATGEMLDLAPVVLYQGKDNERVFTEFADDRRRLGLGLPPLLGALRRGAAGRAPPRRCRRPRRPRSSSCASPSTRRPTPASPSTPARSRGRSPRPAGPNGEAGGA